MQKIKQKNPSSNYGFYVNDSRVFKSFKQQHDFADYLILKEWEIIEEALHKKPDQDLLQKYENRIGKPFLWNSIVCDRRIYLGKKYAYEQDYKPRYNHSQMMSILQVSLIKMDEIFNRLKPNCVITFQCVTMGEYLSYLFAKNRNIVFLNLRPTRIQNYIYAGESITEPSKDLEIAYLRLFEGGVSTSNDSSIEYLNQVKQKNAMYEGVIPSTKKSPIFETHKKKVFGSLFSSRKVLRLLQDEWSYRYGKLRYDNHVSGPVNSIVHQYFYRPMRARYIHRKFKRHYVKTEQLQNINYAFFPLHTEPEVTLLVYSKPYMNQLEAIRLISHNLPIGMKIIVKEHPWNVGKRKPGYFNKLLEIPNLIIASPDTQSRDLINHANLIVVISGSIAMEGMILQKPAIVLGRTPFNFLPKSMMRYISNPDFLDFEIHDLLENYYYDEKAMKAYVQAVMGKSVDVDFYSVLMGRKEAYNPKIFKMSKADLEKEKNSQIEKLAEYLIRRYHELKNPSHKSDTLIL